MRWKPDFASVNKPRAETLREQFANLRSGQARVCGATVLYAGIEFEPMGEGEEGKSGIFRLLRAQELAVRRARQVMLCEWADKKDGMYAKAW